MLLKFLSAAYEHPFHCPCCPLIYRAIALLFVRLCIFLSQIFTLLPSSGRAFAVHSDVEITADGHKNSADDDAELVQAMPTPSGIIYSTVQKTWSKVA